MCIRDRADTVTLFPGGENPAVPLLDETVEPVCEKNVELSGIFCIHGKVDVYKRQDYSRKERMLNVKCDQA